MQQNPTDQIKQKLDVVDVVGSYVQLKKAGKNYKGLCPFHGEKTPSFMVSPELQIFKCFGCGESGDIFSFIQKVEGVDFVDSLKMLAERADVKLENISYDPNSQLKKQIYFINKITENFYRKILLEHKGGKPGLDYLLKKRGLTMDTIKEWKIGYAPKNWDILYKFMTSKGFSDADLTAAGVITRSGKGNTIDKFVGRVVFPFKEIGGKTVGFTGRTIFDREPKYLNTSETLVFNKSTFLFGLEDAKLSIKNDGAVFVEGQMDVVSAHQSGLKNVIATSGTSLTEGQLKVLSRYTKNVAFCFDSDTAGVTAVYRAVELADKQDFDIKAVVIPKEFKDLDEMLKKSADDAKRLIKEPVPVYDYFLVTLLKQYDKSSPYGKKKIAEELIPRFSRIHNKVVYEHYGKRLAEELDMSEVSVFEMMEKGRSSKKLDEMIEKETSKVFVDQSKNSPEKYLMALFLKANLDITRDFMYKLETEDIQDPDVRAVFKKLKKYVEKNGRELDPSTFKESLNDDLKPMFTDLYMWDTGKLSDDPANLVKELEKVIDRVKTYSIKKQLSSLSQRIKLAETENDKGQLEDLTQQFNNLSKQLNI